VANDLFEPCSRLFAFVPTFPVIGNHEKNSHWYYDYFSLPAPEYSYTFKVGNAEFFMVDSNKDCTPAANSTGGLRKPWRLHAAYGSSPRIIIRVSAQTKTTMVTNGLASPRWNLASEKSR
jgi:hypothetical protein